MPYGSDYDSDQMNHYEWQDIEAIDNVAFVPEMILPAPVSNINK